MRMRSEPTSLSNQFPEATAATKQFARYRSSSRCGKACWWRQRCTSAERIRRARTTTTTTTN